jgi:UDP-N-acetylmuramoylalanine--D-glutamate ligase
VASRARARRLPISPSGAVDEGVIVSAEAIARRRAGHDEPLVPRSAVKLIGRHLLADVAAAAAVASIAGVASEAMTRACESFTGLEHALEPVGAVHGVAFVNDSKATNVEAAERAIESFGPGLVAIMGGRFKGGDLGRLRAPLAERGARVVAIGESRARFREALTDVIEVSDAGSMDEAVRLGFTLAPPGGTVLLAPACSSFDMFANYAERGRRFKEAVARLMHEVQHTREQ